MKKKLFKWTGITMIAMLFIGVAVAIFNLAPRETLGATVFVGYLVLAVYLICKGSEE